MGAYIANDLLERIKARFPNDTVDEILDWTVVRQGESPTLTVDDYAAYRVIIRAYRHGDVGELGCI